MKNVLKSTGFRCYSAGESGQNEKKKYAEQLLVQANLYKQISDEHFLRLEKVILLDPTNTEEIRNHKEVADGCYEQMMEKLK